MGCAASGPAQRETAIARVTDRIATVRVCIKAFISRADDVSDATASVKFLGSPASCALPLRGGIVDLYLLDGATCNVNDRSRSECNSHRNMSAEIKKEIQLEIAHVLFIDIVASCSRTFVQMPAGATNKGRRHFCRPPTASLPAVPIGTGHKPLATGFRPRISYSGQRTRNDYGSSRARYRSCR